MIFVSIMAIFASVFFGFVINQVATIMLDIKLKSEE